MSDETVGGVLRHKDTRNIQVRLDYMLLFRNETKAKIIRIMETWTAQKRAEWYKQSIEAKEQKTEPPEEELWVTMSYDQFSLFAYGTVKHDNIKNNVDDLVKEKYLSRRPHPEIPYGSPQYLLNLKLLQKALDEQEIPSLTDDIGKIAPPRKKHTPQDKYPQGRGIYTPRVGGNIPPGTGDFSYPSNNTTKNLLESSENKGEGATSAEDRTAPINLEVAKKKRETNPRMLALSVSSHSQGLSEKEGQTHGHIGDDLQRSHVDSGNRPGNSPRSDHHSHSYQGLEEEDEEPTVKMPITKPQHTIPTTLLEAPAATVLPSPPKDSVQQGALAMTARDIKKQNEKRAKELWTIIEDELHTTFTENQRKAHKDGIASLIADDLSDEAIRTGLQALNTFERRTFTVSKFYGWLPTLSAKAPIFLKKASNGHNRDMVEWQGRYMTVEEADELGFNGGFGAYL